MLRYHDLYQIPWEQQWIEKNYLDKENFVASAGNDRVGIVSLEHIDDQLYVHTVQVVPQFQNKRMGLYILRELVCMMQKCHAQRLACKVFKDNPARRMYERMGFKEVSVEGVLVSMEVQLDAALVRYAS